MSATGSSLPAPTPEADCGPGSRPETSIQGRVPGALRVGASGARLPVPHPAGRPPGHQRGFKVLRCRDSQGDVCAFYDSTLLFPKDVLFNATEGLGVVVLDMNDPAKPVKTANLASPAMDSPHESLLLNARRCCRRRPRHGSGTRAVPPRTARRSTPPARPARPWWRSTPPTRPCPGRSSSSSVSTTTDCACRVTAARCTSPTSDPKLVACSTIASGLRVFDISNVLRPVEAAYVNKPMARAPSQRAPRPGRLCDVAAGVGREATSGVVHRREQRLPRRRAYERSRSASQALIGRSSPASKDGIGAFHAGAGSWRGVLKSPA